MDKTVDLVEGDSWRKKRHMLSPKPPPGVSSRDNKESVHGKNQQSAQMNSQESAARYSITATYSFNTALTQ